MTKQGKRQTSILAAVLFASIAVFSGCETKGPVEQAGENIDKGVENVKETINPSGPAEKAGRSLDNALSK